MNHEGPESEETVGPMSLTPEANPIMRFRDSLAVNISPIMLRLVLGVTFLWAGYGKVFTLATFSPEQIAALDQMVAPVNPGEQSVDVVEPASPDGATEQPEEFTPEAPLPEPDATGADDGADDGAALLTPAVFTDDSAFRVITVQDEVDDPAMNANDRRKVNYLALMIKGATEPGEDGASLLPGFFGQGEWPIRMAWIAALTELIGGAFVLTGILTRISAIGLGFTMLTALWMTSIGPVLVMGEASTLGFLPAINDFAIDAWQGWLWQFALLGASASLFFAGPGSLSADRFFLGRKASKRAQPGVRSAPRPKPKPASDDDDE